MTEHIQYVGNPYAEHYKDQRYIYARNIWDMIEFKGKIYFGGGNSSNLGPATNAGPVPIISYDPQTDSFATAFLTSEEQVDVFYIFNNALYVPGNDPKESWELGNLYKTVNGNVWLKKRTIPQGVHTLCLTFFDDLLFAGLGTAKGGAIAISKDYGDSWELHKYTGALRFYEFLNIGNRLYATGTIISNDFLKSYSRSDKIETVQVVEYTGQNTMIPRQDLDSDTLFPNTSLNESFPFCRITRSQNLGDKILYIGAHLHNDMQSTPFGLYVATSLDQKSISVEKILTNHNGKAWDTYKSANYVYVLTNKETEGKVETAVFRSNNLTEWEELFYFESTQIARSFTFYEGTFYFSLGCEIKNPQKWKAEELGEKTGGIIKLDLYSIE
jgi:hypothetical protein